MGLVVGFAAGLVGGGGYCGAGGGGKVSGGCPGAPQEKVAGAAKPDPPQFAPLIWTLLQSKAHQGVGRCLPQHAVRNTAAKPYRLLPTSSLLQLMDMHRVLARLFTELLLSAQGGLGTRWLAGKQCPNKAMVLRLQYDKEAAHSV